MKDTVLPQGIVCLAVVPATAREAPGSTPFELLPSQPACTFFNNFPSRPAFVGLSGTTFGGSPHLSVPLYTTMAPGQTG
uniref:Secreted protein n=1 Tax=Knipowitschia caucasica TaxID=637954 RepID=A0AAV2MAS1_KNICA